MILPPDTARPVEVTVRFADGRVLTAAVFSETQWSRWANGGACLRVGSCDWVERPASPPVGSRVRLKREAELRGEDADVYTVVLVVLSSHRCLIAQDRCPGALVPLLPKRECWAWAEDLEQAPQEAP